MFRDALRSTIGLRHLVDYVAGLAAFRVHRVLEFHALGDIELKETRCIAVTTVEPNGVMSAHEVFVGLPIGIDLSLLLLRHFPCDVNGR